MLIKKLKGPNNRAVNLHHPTLRNCIFTVTQFSRKYPTPYPCLACNTIHEYKTIHLNLNQHGDVVITDYLYERLKGEGFLEDLTATHETVPLPTVLDLARKDVPPIVMSRELGTIRLGKNGNH